MYHRGLLSLGDDGNGLLAALSNDHIKDDVAGALGSAGTAVGALGVIDVCQVVNNMDCVKLTVLLADLAADAADLAVLANSSALIGGIAGYENLCIIGNLLNELLGTGSCTAHAANALLMIDLGNAVDDVNSVKGAGGNAVTEAHAAL